MNYARWATKEEVAEKLVPIKLEEEIKQSGTPIMYDDKYLYIDQQESHNLIIGTTGSGKTQINILPSLKLAIKAKESIVLNDPKGEIYESTANKLKQEGYKVITLNFSDARLGNSWNPLLLAYELFQNQDKDKAIKLLEDLGYYLFFDPKESNTDPFWFNSTVDYFTGLVLYLFENAKKEEIHLNSVYNLSTDINLKDPKKFLNKINTNSIIYTNVSGTLTAPDATRGSIVSVFNQKMKKYISREILSNMISSSDFDINSISSEKTALFIISGHSSYCENLIPLLISQIVESSSLINNKKRLNILLDEFDSLVPVKDFVKIIDFSRSLNVRFTVVIKSYTHLLNMYSKDEVEILKMCFGNIIYLLSNDIYTLDEISKYCGNTKKEDKIVPLITTEELKTIKPFEAIILMPRMMPFRTKLLPDYKINWSYESKKEIMPERRIINQPVFKINL